MCFTYFSDLFSFQHPPSFLWVLVFICCTTPLRLLGFGGGSSCSVLTWFFGLRPIIIFGALDIKGNFTLWIHVSSRSVCCFNSKSSLRLRKELFVQLTNRMCLRWTLTAHQWLRWLIPFWFVPLHFHYHLEVVQLLCPSQIIDSINKWLFSHGNNFFTDVFDQIIFQLFEGVFLVVTKIDISFVVHDTLPFQVVALILLIWVFSYSFEQLQILLVDTVLLLLYSFNNFVLCFWIIGPSIAVAWNISGLILSAPFSLCHMDPSLWLRLDSHGRDTSVVNKGSRSVHWSSALGCVAYFWLEVLQASNPFKTFGFTSYQNPSLDW